MNKYDDIIGLPHHISSTRKHMSNYDRAAQFSPFAALVGYDEAVAETARLTDTKAELDELRKAELNARLQVLERTLDQRPVVTITYFRPDRKKAGGVYLTIHGAIKKFNRVEGVVVLEDSTAIPIEDIYDIGSPLLPEE